MSKLEVNKIDPQSGTNLELGTSGDTITIPAGATFDSSAATNTLPANVVTTDGTQTLTNKSIVATQLTGTITPSDNTVSIAKLTATGTKDATTFLRGDNTFATVVSGLTEVDVWRYTSQSASAGNYLTANLERDDTTGATYIGTGMSESSGVFTFPSTGKYLIKANGTFYNDTGAEYYASMEIHITTNDSSYSAVSFSQTNSMNTTGTTAYMNSNALFLFDVTNTSTHKVKFYWNRSGNAKIIGSTSVNQTYFLFEKLGET